MITITMPDGASNEYPSPVASSEVLKKIAKSLQKETIAVKINGILRDLSHIIDSDCRVEFISRHSSEGIDIIRHDTAHLMAQAVKELFSDESIEVAIGPTIENGFYYDFLRKTPFSTKDLDMIERHMKKIVERNDPIVRHEWPRDKAIQYFQKQNERFKVEIISSLPEDAVISLYEQGRFLDLCRGPHAPSTRAVGMFFKLTKVSASYWRGDSQKESLQRIYGTAWSTKEDLDNYLHRIKEAEKRDHRRLGKSMELFHLQEEAAGSVFWHPKGWVLYRTIQEYMRNRLQTEGYLEVNTPALVDKSLWEKSGHWGKFRENMFVIGDSCEKSLGLKPMNCPCHVQIFKQGIKSYKDLPLKLAEFGSCFRNEPSGALHGIMRVRSFTQDDAHIFCTQEQIEEETRKFCDLLLSVYADFGFTNISVKFSDRPDTRAGDDAIWDKAESSLSRAASHLSFTHNKGEGAFYGPKLEFVLKDTLGREWQCGTLQLDFVLPERLGAYYIDAQGVKKHPVMLHRAILGSFERFIGILIESYNGHFPLWLAPTQIAIATVTSECESYAEEVYTACKTANLRVDLDLRNEKISYKIREHSALKVPHIFVLGQREKEERSITIRSLGSHEQKTLSLDQAISQLQRDATVPQTKKERYH